MRLFRSSCRSSSTSGCSAAPNSVSWRCAFFGSIGRRAIFAPYWIDAHPDHVAATQLIEAARFWAKLTKSDLPGEPHYPERIYYYYCVHLRLIPQPAFIVDISAFWERKLAALRCYHSQLVEGRPQAPPTFLDGLRDQAAVWGWAIGARYGEPFASRETIGLRTMKGLA